MSMLTHTIVAIFGLDLLLLETLGHRGWGVLSLAGASCCIHTPRRFPKPAVRVLTKRGQRHPGEDALC